MTEELMLEKVKSWATRNLIQFDKLNINEEVTLANGSKTFAANEASYACFSKDDETYKTLVFSYRSLIVFCFENSIITGEEAMILEPAFIIPPPRDSIGQ